MPMRQESTVWFRVINDLLHDTAAGIAPGSVLALWFVQRGAAATIDPTVVATMVRAWSWIVGILFAALVVLIVTGLVRTNYWSATVRPENEKSRGRAALVKHVVFAIVFVYAAAVAFSILQG